MSGAVGGSDHAIYCSTDLFSVFDSALNLSHKNLVSIRALEIGTLDNAKNTVHCSINFCITKIWSVRAIEEWSSR